MKKLYIGIIIICLVPQFLIGGVGTQGGQILRVSHSARDKALAEAVTGDRPEISSFSYNPGGLSSLSGQLVSVTYLRWIADINFATAAYSQNLYKGVITGNINYWGMDAFPQFNSDGEQMSQSLKYSGFGLSCGYGQGIMKRLTGGIKIKYYSEKLMDLSAQVLVIDAGAQYDFVVPAFSSKGKFKKGENLKVGLQIQNMGLFLKNFGKKESVPLALKIGAHYKAYQIKQNTFFLNVDVHEYFQESPAFAFAIQWDMMKILYVRGGYHLALDETITQFGTGLGVQYSFKKSLLGRLDYALVPASDLGITHFITLSVRFGNPKKRSSKKQKELIDKLEGKTIEKLKN